MNKTVVVIIVLYMLCNIVTCIVDNSKDSRDLVTDAISTVEASHVPSYNNLEALRGKLEKCYNMQVWFLQ